MQTRPDFTDEQVKYLQEKLPFFAQETDKTFVFIRNHKWNLQLAESTHHCFAEIEELIKHFIVRLVNKDWNSIELFPSFDLYTHTLSKEHKDLLNEFKSIKDKYFDSNFTGSFAYEPKDDASDNEFISAVLKRAENVLTAFENFINAAPKPATKRNKDLADLHQLQTSDLYLDQHIYLRQEEDANFLLLENVNGAFKYKIKIQPTAAKLINFLYWQRKGDQDKFTLKEVAERLQLDLRDVRNRPGQLSKIYEENQIEPLKSIIIKLPNHHYQLNPNLDCMLVH